QTKINFVLDRFSIAQSGIDPEQSPVSLKLHNVKRRTALRMMLNQYNLGYAIVGEAVIITTDDMAVQRQLKQRVSVDFDKGQLGGETATNLMVDAKLAKEAQAAVTLQLDDVPLETAVRLLCEMAGVKPVRVGNVLYVTNKANAADLRAEADLLPAIGPRVAAE